MTFFDDSPETVPNKRSFTRSAFFPWLVMLTILVILLIIFSPLAFIRSGHRGITTFFGDSQGEILAQGAHFKYPLLRVHQFDVRTQVHTLSTGVVTEDMQLVTLGSTLSYRLDVKELRKIFEDFGTDYQAKLIDPLVKDSVNAAAAMFTAEELVSRRDDVNEAVALELEKLLADRGVILESINIGDIVFSKTLQAAFEAKTVAEQEVSAAKLRNQAAKLDTSTNDQLSEAEAERIESLGKALRGNEAYIQYEIMRKWNGKTPLYLAPPAPVQNVDGE